MSEAQRIGVPSDGLARLWAPWRAAYILSDERPEGCPFCLPADPAGDEERLVLYRGERCYVICNAYPYNPGHVMVCPYTHVGELEQLDAATAGELWALGRRSVAVLRDVLRCDGVNLGMNLGAAAGAGVAEHLHLHVVPRWIADTNFVSTVGATRVLSVALEEVYRQLRPAFDAAASGG